MEDDAVVLHSLELGESDLLLSLYCRKQGRITAIAKGARRSKKRFVNKLEIFSYLSVNTTLKPTNTIAFLHEAELHTSFPTLRTDYTSYLAASLIQELLLAGVKEGEKDNELFRLSLWGFHHVQQKDIKRVVTLFLLRYLDHLGYRPELRYCQSCRQTVVPNKRYTFLAQSGTIHCSGCEKKQPCTIEPGTLKLLQTAQEIPLERLERLKLSSTETGKILPALHSCCQTILQREMHSWRSFLHCCE